VPTLAFAPVTRASRVPGCGPQGRPHCAHAHRAAREPRKQRLSVLCAYCRIGVAGTQSHTAAALRSSRPKIKQLGHREAERGWEPKGKS